MARKDGKICSSGWGGVGRNFISKKLEKKNNKIT